MAKDLYANVNLYATPEKDKHLVNKKYVDDQIGRKIKEPVRVVIENDLGATYDSTEKTLTQDEGSVLEIDGITLAEGDRVLVVGQTDPTQNGIYTVTTLGTDAGVQAVLTRAADFDESYKIYPNVIIPVSEGTNQGDITWQLINNTQPTLDSDELHFGAYRDPAATSISTKTFTVAADEKEWTITHGLNTQNIHVQIYNADGEECWFNVKADTNNTVKVLADVTPEIGDVFTVVVIG